MIGRTNTGGGLSDSNAILRVTVPTGSAVTAAKGGVTKHAKLWTQNADNTLDTAIISIPAGSFDSNPWTVTATLGGSTTTASVVINSADEYDLVLFYDLYLIKGGRLVDGISFTRTGGSTATLTEQSTSVRFKVTSKQGCGEYVRVNDVTRFNSLKISISSGGYSWNGTRTPAICIGTSVPSVDSASADVSNVSAVRKLMSSTGEFTAGTYTLDISSYTGQAYVLVTLSAETGHDGVMYINDFWLE